MRYLFCFEVFEYLGVYGWEVVRVFYKVVIDEVVVGRRVWIDGFEDIKVRFFGFSRGLVWDVEFGRKLGLISFGFLFYVVVFGSGFKFAV